MNQAAYPPAVTSTAARKSGGAKMRRSMSRVLAIIETAWLSVLLLAGSCANPGSSLNTRSLDGPGEIAFTCFGNLRIGDEVVDSPQPIRSCNLHEDQDGNEKTDETPPGQENLDSPPLVYATVLQPARGTVAFVKVDLDLPLVLDADPLAPGRNALPVGSRPVGLVIDHSACFGVTANAGSCDLSRVNLSGALSRIVDKSDAESFVEHVQVNLDSGPLLSRPQAIAVAPEPADQPIGVECPAAPSTVAYVAYPGCNMVAAINTGTGDVLGGINFASGAPVVFAGGAISCPTECLDARDGVEPGMGPAPNPDAPRPVTVDIGTEGGQLVIGAENSPLLTLVTLNETTGVPTAAEGVSLEGDVGLFRVRATEDIAVGGTDEDSGAPFGDFRFAYAAANDGTVRVVKTAPGPAMECETQPDLRFIKAQNPQVPTVDLQCLPVGAATQRRPGRTSPGILLGKGIVPLDIEFVSTPFQRVGSEPNKPILPDHPGTFAYISGSDGNVYVVNIDDDKYPDNEDPGDVDNVTLYLALPHQLRDTGSTATDGSNILRDDPATTCDAGGGLSIATRALTRPSTNLANEEIALEQRTLAPTVLLASENSHLAPQPFLQECETRNSKNEVTSSGRVFELARGAEPETRETAFPDLGTIFSQTWSIVWEGRYGSLAVSAAVEGAQITVSEAGNRFCASGVEENDVAVLVGCSLSANSEETQGTCKIGEECRRHPNAPPRVGGLCFPAETADVLLTTCREFMITNREYRVADASKGSLGLVEKRRTLLTSPVAGCESEAQCQLHYEEEQYLADPNNPSAREPLDAEFMPTFSCEEDAGWPGASRCLMTCEDSDGCEDGFACSSGYCVSGTIPPPECLPTLQRLDLRAANSFLVQGGVSGVYHSRVANETTGVCEDKIDSPLLNSRIPLAPPDCTGAIGEGVCKITGPAIREGFSSTFENGVCSVGEFGGETVTNSQIIRFENPEIAFRLVDPVNPGDFQCIGDRRGADRGLSPFSAVYPGFTMAFAIAGGLNPLIVDDNPTIARDLFTPAYPSRLRVGPRRFLWVLDQGDLGANSLGALYGVTTDFRSGAFPIGTVF